MKKQIAINLSFLLTLSACAAPQVDQTTSTFNETEFNSDLNICRGGNFIEASAKTIGVTVLGSAYGAVEGAFHGARDARTAENAAIGAAVGGTIGFTAGAFDALKKREAEIAGCLVQKGYLVAGP